MGAWVAQDPRQRPFRAAVHTILYTISGDPDLRAVMVMKGGILLALGYDSTRFTKDIDFSTEKVRQEIDLDSFVTDFDAALVAAVEALAYGVDCQVQSFKQRPPRADATVPTIEIKVGYANRGDPGALRRLHRKDASQVVKIDLSVNEPRGEPQAFEIEKGRSIQTYSFHDLVAEKYRAILQQEARNRIRRQDAYDLLLLLRHMKGGADAALKAKILASLKEKAAARDLLVARESLRNPEIRRRSHEQYALLAPEIEGPLPDFEETYEAVREFFEQLPWGQ